MSSGGRDSDAGNRGSESSVCPRRRESIYLFAVLSLVYLLTSGGHVYSPDGVIMGRVTESLVEAGRLSIDDPGYPPGFLTIGRGGEAHGKYGVGLSIAAVPAYLLGRFLERTLPPGATSALEGPTFLWYDASHPTAWRFFGLSLFNAPIAAAVCTLFYLLLGELGTGRRSALLLAVALAFMTPLWVYSKTFFSEPLATLLLLLFALRARRWERTRRERDALVAGLALGGLVLVKVAHAILWPPAAGLVAALLGTSGLKAAARWRSAAWFAAGPLSALLGLGILNAWRFGSPLASGYGEEVELFTTPVAEGLLGLLVSPGRGLFVYMPIALMSVLMFGRSFRRRPLWTAFGAAVPVVLVALYCRWHGWDGGWAWGPRFLLPAMPFLLLLAAPFLDRVTPGQNPAADGLNRWWSRVGTLLLVLSGLVTMVGILVPATEYHQLLRQAIGSGYLPAVRWNWQVWPPWGYLHLPKSYFAISGIWTTPEASILLFPYLGCALLTLVAIVRWRPWRRFPC